MAITKHDHYNGEIDKLISYLEQDTNSPAALDKLQAHLDKLAEHYQNDESLGNERYKLYQAQAMLSYRIGDMSKARGFIVEAMNVRGQSYELAEQLLAHIDDSFTPNPTVRWVVLMALPIPLFLLVALAQLITHFVLNKTTADGTTGVTNLSSTTVNLFSVIVGAVAVVMILLIPVWAVMLVKAKRYNASYGYGLSKRAGVVIAVLLSFWYWLYTYERNKAKFWIGLVLSVLSRGYLAPFIWIWAVVDASNRPDAYYEQYPDYDA